MRIELAIGHGVHELRQPIFAPRMLHEARQKLTAREIQNLAPRAIALGLFDQSRCMEVGKGLVAGISQLRDTGTLRRDDLEDRWLPVQLGREREEGGELTDEDVCAGLVGLEWSATTTGLVERWRTERLVDGADVVA